MFIVILSTLALLAAKVNAESHTVSFNNLCGKGTPMLIQGPNILSQGEPYTAKGVFQSVIAYLQTGECGFNGDNCALVEMTLINPNPSIPGSGSSVDLSLIPDHQLNVPVAIEYTNGCPGVGTSCTTEDCKTAFHVPDDNQVQVGCNDDNVGLLIHFCPSGPAAAAGAVAAPAAPAAPLPPSSRPATSAKPKPMPTPVKAPALVAPAPVAPAPVVPVPSSTKAKPSVASSSASMVSNKPTCKRKPGMRRSSHNKRKYYEYRQLH